MFAATVALGVAYRATAYCVCWRGREVALRIGRRPPPLPWGACWHAWFVTAANPRSRLRPAAANGRAGRRLAEALHLHGLRWVPVVARGDDGGWPAERGVLVFGLSGRHAAALGRRLRQNAILAVGRRNVALRPLA